MALAVGQKAPEFEMKDTEGNVIRLSDYAGKKNIVLSFHPLAWTRVCAAQMIGADLKIEEFRKRDTEIFGVSVDSVESKRAWAAALNLRDLPILADFYPHGAVAESFGILRKVGSSERAGVLIDKAGVIRWLKVYPIRQVPDPAEVLGAIDNL